MKRIDLNCDMGELLPGESNNFDQEIMPYISSCNIACGFHSGTPAIIESTIKSALKHNVKIGAHPSYNDKENFGRKSLSIQWDQLMPELKYQIYAIKGMVENNGGKLYHVKAHGALYNDMVKDKKLAHNFIQLVYSIDPELKIYALANSIVLDLCKEYRVVGIHEAFADRKYQGRTALRSRKLEGAILEKKEDVLLQINNLINNEIELYSGEIQTLKVDSICLHSDTRGAVDLSKLIFEYLKEKNILIE